MKQSEYKEDKLLKLITLQADNRFDADVIYAVLDAKGIGKSLCDFFLSYCLHLESKNKFKVALVVCLFRLWKRRKDANLMLGFDKKKKDMLLTLPLWLCRLISCC